MAEEKGIDRDRRDRKNEEEVEGQGRRERGKKREDEGEEAIGKNREMSEKVMYYLFMHNIMIRTEYTFQQFDSNRLGAGVLESLHSSSVDLSKHTFP